MYFLFPSFTSCEIVHLNKTHEKAALFAQFLKIKQWFHSCCGALTFSPSLAVVHYYFKQSALGMEFVRLNNQSIGELKRNWVN